MQGKSFLPPRRRSGNAGYTLIELILVLAIAAITWALVMPSLGQWAGDLRLRLAAQQMASVLRAARGYAVLHNARVAVRLTTDDNGEVFYALYRDGDGDGVRTADVRSGADPEVWAPRPMSFHSGGIRFGFPPGRPPRHPSNPRQRLTRLDDPIRFNRSDLASFSPQGTATPGSLYLTDSQHRLAAVRVFHRSGKVTVLVYDQEKDDWI